MEVQTQSSIKDCVDLDELDQVWRSDNKLTHLTADRVKAPKRRLPSSVFHKEESTVIFYKIEMVSRSNQLFSIYQK